LVRTSQGKLDEIQNSSSLQIKIVWRKLALAEYHACQNNGFEDCFDAIKNGVLRKPGNGDWATFCSKRALLPLAI
jgi:hypothetical protein